MKKNKYNFRVTINASAYRMEKVSWGKFRQIEVIGEAYYAAKQGYGTYESKKNRIVEYLPNYLIEMLKTMI